MTGRADPGGTHIDAQDVLREIASKAKVKCEDWSNAMNDTVAPGILTDFDNVLDGGVEMP